MPNDTTKKRVCPSCGHENDATYRHCPICRFPLMHIAGKYQIEKELAEGGMGTIYLVRHTGLDYDTERVVKVVKEEIFAHPGTDKRFFREVQITAALSQQNEHIVRIYDDFGEEPGLGHYYVMEHLQGMTLSALLEQQEAIPLPISLHILYQTAKALSFAHESNVIHRDLKPDNIFLIKRGFDEHFVKLLDFGIARPEKTDTKLTQGVLGTPLYMSPEQCSNADLDNRADIYSMGIILYEMLTGRWPYGLDLSDEGGTSPFSVLSAHLKKPPIPIHHFAPELAWLSPIVASALSKKPHKRYGTMRELWDAIRDAAPPALPLPAFESGSLSLSSTKLPVQEGLPSGSFPQATQPRKRRTVMFVATVVVVLLLSLGTWGLSAFWTRQHNLQTTQRGTSRLRVLPPAIDAGDSRTRTQPTPRIHLPDHRAAISPVETRPLRRPNIRKRAMTNPIMQRRTLPRRRRRRKPKRPMRRSLQFGPCGKLKRNMNWVFATLAQPSTGRASLQFVQCLGCRWKRTREGYCLSVPKNRKIQAKIILTGYQTCRFVIQRGTKRLRWYLKIDDPNELADEHYKCIR